MMQNKGVRMRENRTGKIGKKRIMPTIMILLTLLIIIVLAGYLMLKNYFFPLKHFDIIQKEAAKYNIDPYLILSVIRVESGFNKHATSNKQAKGLMQIMDTTATEINEQLKEELDTADIYDENVNIALGCKYLNSLIKKYDGNYYLAVCAYNAGMGNVDKWITQGIISEKLSDFENPNIPFPETKKYLKKVISSYEMYKILY